MAQLSLPNVQQPDLYKGNRELYKSLGQLLGMAGGAVIGQNIADTRDTKANQELEQLINQGKPKTIQAPNQDALSKYLALSDTIKNPDYQVPTTEQANPEYVNIPPSLDKYTRDQAYKTIMQNKIAPKQQGPKYIFKPDENGELVGIDSNNPSAPPIKTGVKSPEQKSNPFVMFTKGYTEDHPNATPSEIFSAYERQRIEGLKEVAKERGVGFAEARPVGVVDEGVPTFVSFGDVKKNREQGKIMQASQYSPAIKESMGAATQRTGQRSASVTTASQVFDQEAPEILAIRDKVKQKGLLPTGGLKSAEALNQWFGEQSSDPDVVELKKKTKLLADALQRTMGGSQGGQWAFEVASDILDPRFDTPAFQRILESHSKTLHRMSDAYRNFGKEPSQAQAPIAGPKFTIKKVE